MMLARKSLVHLLRGLGVVLLLGGGTGVAAAQGSAQTPLLSIGPGDVLEINVLGVDELSKKVRVLGDGTITLPLLGNFSIAGMTVTEAEAEIGRTLAEKKLVNEPQVSIFVEESVSASVTVQGAVVKPGVYELFGQRTLLEVLGRAGGLNRERGAEILVLRRGEDGEQESLQVDATQLVEEGDVSLNLQLQPGDIVMVPVARKLRVYVTGAVTRPGAVEYSSSEGITVLQAVTAAGGPTERANLKKVTLRRRLEDGTEESREINLKKIQNGKEPDIPLKRNDTIVVREWLL